MIYFVLVAAVIIGVQCAREKITLQLAVKPGDTFVTRTTNVQQISQTIQNVTNELAQEITMDLRYDVLSQKADSSSMIKMTYERIGFSQRGPFGSFEYRSWESPDEVPLAAQGFAILVGKSIEIELSTDGKVIGVSGHDAILDDMLESLEMTLDDNTRAMLKDNFKRQFGQDAVKENMGRMFVFYPDKPVGSGDSWNSIVKLATGIPLIVNNQCRITDIKDGKVMLAVESKIEPNKDERVTQVMGMDMFYDVHGMQEGTIVLDSISGWTLEGHLEQTFEGAVKITSQQVPEESMDIPMTVSSTITYATIEPGE